MKSCCKVQSANSKCKKNEAFNKKHRRKELLQNAKSKCKNSDALKRKVIGETLNPNSKK